MNNTTRTPRKVKKFLEVLGETANVSSAARSAGIQRELIYAWRKQDPDFAKKMDEAVELGTAALEDEAIRRAHHGWDEPVFYKGEQCGTIRKYSDQLLMNMLKARKPLVYREGIEDTARGNFTLNVNVVNTPERIEAPKPLEEIQARADAVEVVVFPQESK